MKPFANTFWNFWAAYFYAFISLGMVRNFGTKNIFGADCNNEF